MKIIFLDIDGVLNTGKGVNLHFKEGGHPNLDDEFGTKFCPNAVENLRLLIESSGADTRIVVSSTWRLSGIKKLKDMWKARGLPGEVFDITIAARHKDVSIPRGAEIEAYLRELGYWSYRELLGESNKESIVESYVILDDDSDMLYNQKDHFVLLDAHVGFADKRKLRKAINIMKMKTI